MIRTAYSKYGNPVTDSHVLTGLTVKVGTKGTRKLVFTYASGQVIEFSLSKSEAAAISAGLSHEVASVTEEFKVTASLNS
jgi:hypothetical protein